MQSINSAAWLRIFNCHCQNGCLGDLILFSIFKANTEFWNHNKIVGISFRITAPSIIKVYILGGETDSAIRWRKRTAYDVVERLSGSWLLRTFLKLSLKMPYIFWEFVCCNRKLCVNKPISFFSYNTGSNVNKKMTRQQLK